MYRRMAFILVAVSCLLAQPPVNPSDSVLVAYHLTPQQEAQFNHTDGVMSPFWDDWQGRDSIDMVPSRNCLPERCGFAGDSDASLRVKAAATERGLYLWLVVRDDVFVGPDSLTDWGADVIDVYLDVYSSTEIDTCTGCLAGLYGTSCTWGTCQYQFHTMGHDSLPTYLRFVCFDWFDFLTTTAALDFLWQANGYAIEPLRISSGAKGLEWFIPWAAYSANGLQPGTVLAGRRLGFTVGFNDRDTAAADPDCLRWLGRDPWWADSSNTYWGDLLLADDMPPVGPAQAVRPTLSCRVPNHGTRRAMVVYDLTGRHTRATATKLSSGVALRRLSDGRTMRVLHAD